jgi:hypothetical protein
VCSEGNNYFKNKDYERAIEKYSQAIAADGSDVTFYSNRRFYSNQSFL